MAEYNLGKYKNISEIVPSLNIAGELHAKELGLDGIENIAEKINDFIKNNKLTILFTKIDKKHVSTLFKLRHSLFFKELKY